MKKNRAKQAIKGFATDFGGNVLLALFGFITTPIIIHLVSKSLYGFWLTTLSILGYLVLTDLGLGMSFTRLVATLTDKHDDMSINRVISTSFFTYCAIGLLFLLVGLSFSPFIPVWFKIAETEVPIIVPAYQVAVLAGALALPLSVFGGIINGFQRMAIVNIVRDLVGLVGIGVSLLLLFAGLRIMALALSSLFVVLTGGAINYLFARRIFQKLHISITLFNQEDLKRLIKFGGYFQLGRIATTVALSTDNIIIAAFMSTAMVTSYVFSSKLVMLFSLNFAAKMPIAFFPALSQMFSENDIFKIQRVFILLVRYSTRLAIIASVFVAVVNSQFVSLWVGEKYFGGPLLNSVFVYWILSTTIGYAITAVIYASGELRNFVLVSLAEAVINLIASFLMVVPFGLVGVALGTSIGKTLTTGWYTPYWICRKIKLPFKNFIWLGVLKTTFRSLPGVVLTLWFAFALPTNLNWGWVILVGLVALLTNVISFEGIELTKPSSLPFRKRALKLLTHRMTDE